MSMSAQYHAEEWAKGKTRDEILAEISRLDTRAAWQGAEFDDVRVRHMQATRRATLLAIAELSKLEAGK